MNDIINHPAEDKIYSFYPRRWNPELDRVEVWDNKTASWWKSAWTKEAFDNDKGFFIKVSYEQTWCEPIFEEN